MTWTPPTYVEVKMDAEFSAYVDELALDLESPDVTAPHRFFTHLNDTQPLPRDDSC
jgi:hypothetical protein